VRCDAKHGTARCQCARELISVVQNKKAPTLRARLTQVNGPAGANQGRAFSMAFRGKYTRRRGISPGVMQPLLVPPLLHACIAEFAAPQN
jgi:hypothetical protein